MPTYPACDFPLLDDVASIGLVRQAVDSGDPFSLIRLGDGEAVVLSFDDNIWLQDLAYLHGHWGSEGVTLEAVGEVRRDLEVAVKGADLVGIRDDVVGVSLPADLLDRSGREVRDGVLSAFPIREDERENLSSSGARRLALLHRVLSHTEWPAGQRFCSAWIHWELLASGALAEILGSVDEVGLVSAHPELEALVAQQFAVRTSAVVVPDKFTERSDPGAHVPQRYRTIRSELVFPAGSLVLVGAGIPGKVYCQWLKEAGCVAIDVGSVFDAWVGKASRPRVLESRFRVKGGDRVPQHLQLRRLTAPSGDRQLTPRWKPTGLSL